MVSNFTPAKVETTSLQYKNYQDIRQHVEEPFVSIFVLFCCFVICSLFVCLFVLFCFFISVSEVHKSKFPICIRVKRKEPLVKVL